MRLLVLPSPGRWEHQGLTKTARYVDFAFAELTDVLSLCPFLLNQVWFPWSIGQGWQIWSRGQSHS